MDDLISRQAAMAYPLSWEHYDKEHGDMKFICGVESYREYIEHLPSAEPKEVYCSMASRTCFANGKEVAWCLTCPHISEEDRKLVKKAVEGSEPKTGKWIRHDEVRNVYGGTYVECSECGEKYVVQHIEDEKYCRNCGADMRTKEYERAVDQLKHDMLYEPTFNQDDGSM